MAKNAEVSDRVKHTANSKSEVRAEEYVNYLLDRVDYDDFRDWCGDYGLSTKQCKKVLDAVIASEVILIWPGS